LLLRRLGINIRIAAIFSKSLTLVKGFPQLSSLVAPLSTDPTALFVPQASRRAFGLFFCIVIWYALINMPSDTREQQQATNKCDLSFESSNNYSVVDVL
jgi:hypothetical protein